MKSQGLSGSGVLRGNTLAMIKTNRGSAGIRSELAVDRILLLNTREQ